MRDLNHDDVMTRGEFLVEILEILDLFVDGAVKDVFNSPTLEQRAAEIQTAIDVIKRTYAFDEYMNQAFYRNQINSAHMQKEEE